MSHVDTAAPQPIMQSPPLWQLLQATAHAVQGTLAGQSLTPQLAQVPAQLRAGVQALSFHVLRQLGMAQALRARLAPRKPAPATDALLCCALALGWDEAHAPYAMHTLVSQTVEAARRQRHTEAQAAFVNACLRRFVRERTALLQLVATDAVAQWNHPRWWIERLQRDHPEHWQGVLHAAQKPAPMTIRVNAQRGTVQAYQQRLVQAGLGAGQCVAGSGLVLQQAVPVSQLPGFEVGDASVQDAAAQWAAPLLLQGWQPPQGVRILDACAAPGGKTGHLLELRPDAQVVALDIDGQRCERIEQNLRRLGVQAQVLQADAAQPHTWWDGRAFDAILLDAPCTASGIVRRHPDVRWLRRVTDSDSLAATQAHLLAQLWPLLAVGGRMLYATCSVFLAEGDAVVQAFLASHPQARLCPSPGHLVAGVPPKVAPLSDNGLGEHDHFYYALLEKIPAPS